MLWGPNSLFRSEEIQNHLEIQNPEVGNPIFYRLVRVAIGSIEAKLVKRLGSLAWWRPNIPVGPVEPGLLSGQRTHESQTNFQPC